MDSGGFMGAFFVMLLLLPVAAWLTFKVVRAAFSKEQDASDANEEDEL